MYFLLYVRDQVSKQGKKLWKTHKGQRCTHGGVGDEWRAGAVLRRVGAFGGRPRVRRSLFVSRSMFWTRDADEGGLLIVYPDPDNPTIRHES